MRWIACSDRVDWGSVDLEVDETRSWCRDPLVPGGEDLGFVACVEDLDTEHLDRRLRSAGFDPLAVPVVVLSDVDRAADDRIRSRMSAARLRCDQYAGALPEHLKPILPTAVTRRSFLTFGSPSYRTVPHPDDSCGASDGCRACVDICPHNALDWSSGVVTHDRLACEGCGRCVTICPTGAMVNPEFTPAQLEAEIEALVAGHEKPTGIQWYCARGPVPEAKADWHSVAVPCVGMLPPHWIIGPLAQGAAAVALADCQCDLEQDSTLRAIAAFDAAREWLTAAGIAGAAELLPESRGAVSQHSPLKASLNPYGPHGAADLAAPMVEVDWESDLAPLGIVSINHDSCTGCEACATVCPSVALTSVGSTDGLEIWFEPSLCTGCEQCVTRCPEEGAIRLRRAVVTDDLAAGQRRLVEHQVAKCVQCGGSIATQATLTHIAAALGDDPPLLKQITSVCLDCRGTTMVF